MYLPLEGSLDYIPTMGELIWAAEAKVLPLLILTWVVPLHVSYALRSERVRGDTLIPKSVFHPDATDLV